MMNSAEWENRGFGAKNYNLFKLVDLNKKIDGIFLEKNVYLDKANFKEIMANGIMTPSSIMRKNVLEYQYSLSPK